LKPVWIFTSGRALMEKYECGMCEYTYDPAIGDAARGIPPGTSFDDLPNDWKCPKCNAGKNMFTEA
jgi:rubredoxin